MITAVLNLAFFVAVLLAAGMVVAAMSNEIRFHVRRRRAENYTAHVQQAVDLGNPEDDDAEKARLRARFHADQAAADE